MPLRIVAVRHLASYFNLVRFPLLAGNWTSYAFPNITHWYRYWPFEASESRPGLFRISDSD
jgi:hypothetical protein